MATEYPIEWLRSREVKREQKRGLVPGLVGMWLHTIGDDGWFKYQGKIVGLDGDAVLVQLFEWGLGNPTIVKSMPKSEVLSGRCRLYGSGDAMKDAWDAECFRRYGRENLPWRGLEEMWERSKPKGQRKARKGGA